MVEKVRCGMCKSVLDEPQNVPSDARHPCPECGSLSRLHEKHLAGSVNATGTLTAAFVASAAAAVYAAARIFVRPPGPEPGYHPLHGHGDVVGESILVALGVAGLVAVGRRIRGSRGGSTFRL
jgi:hypothetical protein